MKHNIEETVKNIVRHGMKKFPRVKIQYFKFNDPYMVEVEDGLFEEMNPDVEVHLEIPCEVNLKFVNTVTRMENKLIKKYGMNLIVV